MPPDQALPALIPLLTSVVQNLAQLGLPGALTGPVERGDVSSVERHLKTLEARAPELLALYRLVGRDVLRLAREKTKLDPAGAARIEALFSEGRGNGGNGRTDVSADLEAANGLIVLACHPRTWPKIGPLR